MNPALRGSAAHVFVESLDAPRIEPGDLHHLARVLRIRSSDLVTASDGQGRWVVGHVRGDDFVASAEPVLERSGTSRGVITAIPKGDRPELIVQKLTELGLDRIGFVETDRSVVRWDGRRRAAQTERLRRVAREAAMQSRRVRLPTIELLNWDDALAADGVALAEPGGGSIDADVRTIVVGPEGGFTDGELAQCARHVTVSAQVLRVETAAIAAGVLLMRDG